MPDSYDFLQKIASFGRRIKVVFLNAIALSIKVISSMDFTDINAQKKAMRSDLHQKRNALSVEFREEASWAASEAMFELIAQSAVKKVGIFLPIRSEINTFPLINKLLKADYEIGLPITGEFATPLIFRQYMGMENLVQGKFNTREPHPDNPLISPEFLVVPLLGYDANCYRMGYGGGHYDATISELEQLHPLKAFGFAFSKQQVEKVITEPHDRSLDGVVNENGVMFKA